MPIPPESFLLDPHAPGTLQARIQQMVAAGILSGRFRAGEKMPSTRGLAAHLGVSRITVTLAYTELVADDYLTARGRSGYFVSADAPEPPAFAPQSPAVTTVDWPTRLGPAIPPLGLDKPRDWARYRYNFIYGQADATLFDAANWRLCALQALGRRDWESLAADQFDGDDPLLVDFIARQMLPRRGILASPSEILLTLGAQNALWLAAQILTPGQRVAMEDPGYPALRGILSQTGCALTPVAVDAEGLPPEALPAVDVIFTTPAHQCPTTVTMPIPRREALLELAEARDMIVVEDDYEFELPAGQSLSPALKALDRGGRVIYVGSFSKSVFPGLRLGYLVGPAPFIAQARALRALSLRHPPGHVQRTLAHFLSRGHYDALIRRTGRAYAERRAAMETAVAGAGLQVVGRPAAGGSSLWLRAPGRDMGAAAVGLRDRGVLIEPGAAFFAGGARWTDARPTGAGAFFAGSDAVPVGFTHATVAWVKPTISPQEYYRLAWSSIPVGRIAEGVALL